MRVRRSTRSVARANVCVSLPCAARASGEWMGPRTMNHWLAGWLKCRLIYVGGGGMGISRQPTRAQLHAVSASIHSVVHSVSRNERRRHTYYTRHKACSTCAHVLLCYLYIYVYVHTYIHGERVQMLTSSAAHWFLGTERNEFS